MVAGRKGEDSDIMEQDRVAEVDQMSMNRPLAENPNFL